MEIHEFAIEMGRTCVATQSELDDAAMEVYFEAFNGWTIDSFQSAMLGCRNELNRFPTVAQIRERYPRKKPDTIEDINRANYVPLLSVVETADELGPDKIEQQIDAMTDEALYNLFWPLFENSKTCGTQALKDQAIDWSISQFRRNPKGRMYRGFIRDAIVRGENWVREV